MAQRPHVPKFGNWEKEQVQYTVFFENARVKKGAGGGFINPNDPEENPEVFNNQKNFQEEEERRERARQQYNREQRQRRVEGEDREYMKSPYQAFGNKKEEPSSERPKVYRNSNASEITNRRSQPRSSEEVGEGNRPPSSSSAQNNPMRPKFTQQVEAQQQHHRVVSVPKFGDWNGGNVDAGAGYTVIFDKVKEDKQNAVVNPPIPAYTPPRYQQDQKTNSQKPAKSSIFCCFGH